MKITSAVFMRGIKGDNEILEDGIPQVAFIGRSNVGKSSLMNSLTGKKKLARISITPGRTQEMNVFLINGTHYFMDLPGYGFAKANSKTLEKLSRNVHWYLFESPYANKVALLIDAEIGPTKDDLVVLRALEQAGKEIIIVLNKIDKIKKSQYHTQYKKLCEQFAGHVVFPYSSKTKSGIEALTDVLLA